MFSEYKKKFKTDKVFQKKVRTVFIFSIILIFCVGLYYYNNNSNNAENNNDTGDNLGNRVTPINYVEGDSINFVEGKTDLYTKVEQEDKDLPLIPDNSSAIEPEGNSNIVSSSRTEEVPPIFSPPARVARSSAPRRVVSTPPVRERATRVRERTPDIFVAPNRGNNIVNDNNSIASKAEDVKETVKELTAEEKLEQAIRSKYKGSGDANSPDNISVLAVIHNDQLISAKSNSVRLRLLEPIYINGNKIGTDAFVTAIAQFSQNQLKLTVRNIAYKNKQYPISLVAYDARTGMDGIAITEENIIGDLEDKATEQASRRIRGTGVVGEVIQQIFSGRNRVAKIQLFDEHRLILKNK